jgi:hypothetical protein
MLTPTRIIEVNAIGGFEILVLDRGEEFIDSVLLASCG